jgi:hypothetical protein
MMTKTAAAKARLTVIVAAFETMKCNMRASFLPAQ